jgi:hypothetical protein
MTRFFIFLRLFVVLLFDGFTNPWVLSYSLLFVSKLFTRDSFRVIVTGSQEFDDYAKLAAELDKYLSGKKSPEIVSGTSRGAERLAEWYGRSRGIPVRRFQPDWKRHGRSAGYERYNKALAYADSCVVFGGTSWKMTAYLVQWAKRLFLEVHIIK